MSTVLRALPITLVLMLIVASCSSSETPTGSATAESSPTSVSVVSTTVAPSDEAQPAPTTTVTVERSDTSSSADVDEFCGRFQDRVDRLAAFVADGAALFDPAAFEAFADQQLSLLEQAQPHVPSEIGADFELALVDARRDHELFAEFDFDVAEIFQSQLLSPTLSSSNPELERFVAEECGIERNGEPVSSDSQALGSPSELAGDAEALGALLETNSGRQVVVDQLSEMLGLSEEDALCLIETVDLTNVTALGGDSQLDPEALVEVFAALETCEIPLSALVSAAS